MMAFMKLENNNVWDVVEDGPYVPTKFVNGENIKKPKEEWNDGDRKLISYNHKAMHILFCALSRDLFNKVQQFQNAQEIWHTLEVTYEGTKQVKENKESLLVYKYELFKMKPDESIQTMFDRFNDHCEWTQSYRKDLHTFQASKEDSWIIAKTLSSNQECNSRSKGSFKKKRK